MQPDNNASNDDGAEHAGIQCSNACNRGQTAGFCGRVHGDANITAPVGQYLIDKIVEGQVENQRLHAAPSLFFFCQTDRKTNDEQQGHLAENCPGTFIHDSPELEPERSFGGQAAENQLVGEQDGNTDYHAGKGK